MKKFEQMAHAAIALGWSRIALVRLHQTGDIRIIPAGDER